MAAKKNSPVRHSAPAAKPAPATKPALDLTLTDDLNMYKTQVNVRLEILKVLVPVTSRLGVNDPKLITKAAVQLEQYVLKGHDAPKSVEVSNLAD